MTGTDRRDDGRRAPPDQALPLIAHIRRCDGWIFFDELVTDLGLTRSDGDKYVKLLNDTGEIDTYKLGNRTLIVLREADVREVIVEWSDRNERHWRTLTRDQMPDLNDRREG